MFGVLAAMVVAAELVITSVLRFQSERLIGEIAVVRHESSQLYKDIGYGGIIHDFKNYVLRDEAVYAERVRELAQRVDQRIALLDRAADQFGIEVDYSATGEMVDAYSSRISVIGQMRSDGHTAEEIDSIVGYDDRPAIDEILENEILMTRRLESDVSVIQMISLSQTIITTLLSIIVLILVTLLLERRRRHDLTKLKLSYDEKRKDIDLLAKASR